MITEIPIITRHREAVVPHKAAKDVGFLLYTPDDVVVAAHGAAIVDTGIRLAMPKEHGIMVIPVQALMKTGIMCLNMVYGPQHETIMVVLQNLGGSERRFLAGDVVGQFVYTKITEVGRFFIQRRDLAPVD